jgi:hypothetical protein
MTPDQVAVGFMKLAASLGNRNGHTGIFPLNPGNTFPFHEYPFLVYEFADGVYVTRGDGLVGARLTAIGGVPIEDVLAQLAPVVPTDNAYAVRNLRPMYLLSAEVLDGLAIAPQFSFTLRNGSQVVREPAAMTARRWLASPCSRTGASSISRTTRRPCRRSASRRASRSSRDSPQCGASSSISATTVAATAGPIRRSSAR